MSSDAINISQNIEADFFVKNINRIIFKPSTANWRKDHIQYDENYSLVFTLEGEANYKIEGHNEKLLMNKDSLYIFPPGNKRSGYATKSKPWSFIFVNFDIDFYEERNILFDGKYFYMSECSGEVEKKIQKLVRTWESKNEYYKVKCRIILSDIIYYLLIANNYGQANYHTKSLIKVNKYIHEHFTEQICVESLAKMAELSVSYFRKVFTEAYDMSPMKYVTKLRLEKAQDLLRGGHFNVSETADLCGFNDVFYFSKIYKQKMGVSPSEELKFSKFQ